MPNTGNDQSWEAYNAFHFTCDQRRFQKIFSRIDLFKMVLDVPGDIVDAGAFKGISTIQFAQLLQAYQPNTRSKVVSFDTFESTFSHLKAFEKTGASDLMKDFKKDAYSHLLGVLENLNLNHRVHVVRGDILKTMPAYIEANPGFRINFLHCDLDAYEPTLATLKAAWHRVVPGGIVVFDEYAIENWGESNAVDEFLKTVSPRVELKLLQTSPTPTAYCKKLG